MYFYSQPAVRGDQASIDYDVNGRLSRSGEGIFFYNHTKLMINSTNRKSFYILLLAQ